MVLLYNYQDFGPISFLSHILYPFPKVQLVETMQLSIIERKLQRIRQGRKPRVLDLFAGAGGFSLGFLTAGFEIAAAVEIDPFAARTHAVNFFRDSSDEEKLRHGHPRDITAVEPDDLLREYGYNNPEEAIDVIIGGPPCQAFARVGRAKLREIAAHPEAYMQDPRANLYLRFIQYVRVLKPLAILMENVPDALNHGGHNIAEETCEVFSANGLGYRCAYTLLNSSFFGVPQMRERMFLLAYAEELDSDVEFPSPTHWIDLPGGYKGTRSVALKLIKTSNGAQTSYLPESDYFRPLPERVGEARGAVSVEDAIGDLPKIYALDLLTDGRLSRGVQDPCLSMKYPADLKPSSYGLLMKNWPGFETGDCVSGQIIRYLPRDYKLFAHLQPGDQYPEAYKCAETLFREEILHHISEAYPLPENFEEIVSSLKEKQPVDPMYHWIEKVWISTVPPYDPGKFPNKWRKMEANLPARTVMAHLGKDSYSHIHYDSRQARTISVREAARIQSFPDGFLFYGKMNAAFKQIGNAVPPLLAYRIAVKVMEALGQEPTRLEEDL